MIVTLREADHKDIPLLTQFMQKYYEYDRLNYDKSVATKALQEFLNNRFLGRIWLILSAGKEIGYVVLSYIQSLEFHGSIAFIDELFILDDDRRKGAGKRVLDLVADFCKSEGIHALRLEVEKSNTAAQGFYEKFGFVRHDRFIMTRWLEGK